MADVLDCRLGGWRTARVVGVKYCTLDSWVRTGLLPKPAIPGRGKGSRRGFSFVDLIRARTVARLRQEGVSLQTIRKVVRTLSEQYCVGDPLAQTADLVVAGGEVFWATDEVTLLNVLRQQLAARPLVLVDMSELVADTAAKVEAIYA